MRCLNTHSVLIRLISCAALIALISTSTARAQRISVSLFDATSVQAISFAPLVDGYILLINGIKHDIPKGQSVRAERFGDSIRLSSTLFGARDATHAALVHQDPTAAFSIQPINPPQKTRHYDGNLSLYVDFARLMTNNLVDQERYVAGVALAEVGGYASSELYKAQILLARTYLLSNRNRHIEEGYNVCDQVHCQAYKGTAAEFPTIIQAAKSTRKLVVLDRNGHFITSVFHANCGGYTAAAGDVWLTDNDYLRAVNDPYCRRSRGANWTADLDLNDWKRLLHSKGVPTERLQPRDYTYISSRREPVYLLPGALGVPFRDIREYFNLKSAWFDVQVRGNRVHLTGRGYGHGIGLCQEGAIQMGKIGKTAQEIIQFYFQGVRIAPASEAIQR